MLSTYKKLYAYAVIYQTKITYYITYCHAILTHINIHILFWFELNPTTKLRPSVSIQRFPVIQLLLGISPYFHLQPGHILLVQMLVWCSAHRDTQLEISHELNSAVIIPRRVHLGGWMVIVSKSSSYALKCFTILQIWFQQPTPFP